MTLVAGTIVRVRSRAFTAEVDGREVPVVIPKRLRYLNRETVDPVAVGDRVRVDLGGREAVVEGVEPRRNQLSRVASGRRGRRQVLAANLDLVVVVLAAADPPFKTTTLDRYLVLAAAGGAPAALCLNKVDLDPAARDREEFDVYRALGIPVVATSVPSRTGLDDLERLVAGQVCAVIGPSGVGKSSLIEALVPGAELATGEISERTGKGQHTTTWVEMWRLPCGGRLIDSPGLRALDLSGVDPDAVAGHFPEISRHAPECRFQDCRHLAEPGCAVKEAVRNGEMAAFRYESYRRIRESLIAGEG